LKVKEIITIRLALLNSLNQNPKEMRAEINPQIWREQRLLNYRKRLGLSKLKAYKLLSKFGTIPTLIKEFDRVVDSPFRSNNEPGISFEERKRRAENIYNPKPDLPRQLELF
jgi:hypothetical protein